MWISKRLNLKSPGSRSFLLLYLLCATLIFVTFLPQSCSDYAGGFRPLQWARNVLYGTPQKDSSNCSKDYLSNEVLVSSGYEFLSPDVSMIVMSVIEARSKQIDPPKSLTCKGDRMEYEVEDLLCIPRPKFIKELRNPCWWDNKTAPQPLLRCLPYFHILGCEKCATTDLWKRIAYHPHIINPIGIQDKEPSWWSWGRYGVMNYQDRPIRDFNKYTESFIDLSRTIEKALLKGTKTPKDPSLIITGDATPSDLTDFRFWANISQNRGLKEPRVITPHLMKHLYPDPKFIIIYRDPVERLYSEYHYTNQSLRKHPKDFHRKLLKSIRMLAVCVRAHGIRHCAFDYNLNSAMPLKVHHFFDSLFIAEWLKVYPRERFLILKSEEYSQDIQGTLETCFQFLGLEMPEEDAIKGMANATRSNVGKRGGHNYPMLPASRRLLEMMAGPTTRILADILGNDKFACHQQQLLPLPTTPAQDKNNSLN